jgi:hypothetical protein
MVKTEDEGCYSAGDCMKDIIKAVYDKFSTVNDFKTAIDSQFYFNVAPQSITRPYSVFQLITNTATYNFTSTFDDAEIQIDILDDNNSSNILDLADKCMSLFDDCTLTIASHQFMGMERDWNMVIEDAAEEIQRYTIQYTVSTRKPV